VDLVMNRSKENKDYGVILVPEGLIEFIPEVGALISEINDLLADPAADASMEGMCSCVCADVLCSCVCALLTTIIHQVSQRS
jgi:hypothetical protein